MAGLSYAEIARELKLTQSAVETLIFRARRSLATNLDAMVVKPRLLARARHAIELAGCYRRFARCSRAAWP